MDAYPGYANQLLRTTLLGSLPISSAPENALKMMVLVPGRVALVRCDWLNGTLCVERGSIRWSMT
jgi:hypothetical protein